MDPGGRRLESTMIALAVSMVIQVIGELPLGRPDRSVREIVLKLWPPKAGMAPHSMRCLVSTQETLSRPFIDPAL
jgi:hypothetical protein